MIRGVNVKWSRQSKRQSRGIRDPYTVQRHYLAISFFNSEVQFIFLVSDKIDGRAQARQDIGSR